MASIKQRGKSYLITVSNGYDVNGKKITKNKTVIPDDSWSEKKKADYVKRMADEFEAFVKSGKYLDGEKITLKAFCERWKKDYAEQQLEETTRSVYYEQIETIIQALGHIKLAELKPLHLLSFYNNLTENGIRTDGKSGGYSYATIKHYHAVLSSILASAVQWQLIESNPCDNVKVPKSTIKSSINKVQYFTLEQATRFLEALDMSYETKYKGHTRIDDTGKEYYVNDYVEVRKIPTQFKSFFNIALFGGLRKGEILALKWDDVNFDANTIRISKSVAYVNRKIIIKDPKNKSSVREVKLPTSVMSLLLEHKKEQNLYRLSIGDAWEGDNFLFIQASGKVMHPTTPYHTFKDILKKYNSTVKNECDKLPDITLHDLRHTSATLLIANHVDIKTVSERLGHANTSTTMNIYAHALKELDEKAADTLEDILTKKA